MLIDKDTRVINIPLELKELAILKIPNPVDGTPSTYLLDQDKLYELRQINGSNPVRNKHTYLPQSTTPVKSWVFEAETDSDRSLTASSSSSSSGWVLQSPAMIVSSRYDLTYTLLYLLSGNSHYTERYATIEDIMDTIAEDTKGQCDVEWILKLGNIIPSLLLKICETLDENDETFYKYSEKKALELVQERITRLLDHLKIAKDTAVVQRAKNKLLDVVGDIPGNILEQAVTRVAFELVLCYCKPEFTTKLAAQETYQFKELVEYEKQLEQKKKDLAIAEQNLNAVAESSGRAAKYKKKPAPVKKTAKKVAVGKGALDSFFKRDK